MLVLLEHPFIDIKKEHKQLSNSDFLNLVHFALDFEVKEYWPELAVDWLTEGLEMKLETKDKLQKIINEKAYAQRLRHKCLKLLK